MAEPLSLEEDLGEFLDRTRDLWTDLKGARLFITGGTGFIGCWLLETLRHANDQLDLGIRTTVLSRDPDAFRRKAPHLAEARGVELLRGDVLAFPGPQGAYSHVIHAATDASAHLIETNPLRMFDTIVLGTRQVLEWAATASAERVLFTSSGAVYGRQPSDLERIPDGWGGAPDCTSPSSAYAEGKRAAENLCAMFARQHGLQVPIARCFAFVGPYLPLDIHFAIGNFIRDAMAGGPIRVQGDGTPYRSYLYAADLAAWLWFLLLKGPSTQPVNVGSDCGCTISELAHEVAGVFGGLPVQVLGVPVPGAKPARYVPDVGRARALGLEQTVSLREGIRRTARWHGHAGRLAS